MATVTAGYNWSAGETVTATKLTSTGTPTVAVADAEVTAAKLASNAVETAKIADATSTTTGVTNGKLRHSAALSVIGRSADSAGAPADIAAANDGEVFRRSGTSVGFGTVATAGIANAAVTPAKLSQPLTLATAQNTTSGTSIDFTGIPSWVRRITVMFNGVSLSGSAQPRIRVGRSSGSTIVTTGYAGAVGWSGSDEAFSSGFEVASSGFTNSANLYRGIATLVNISGNIWCYASNVSAASSFIVGAGTVDAGGTLDTIRLTTTNGTDTFDAGSVNIMYEG